MKKTFVLILLLVICRVAYCNADVAGIAAKSLRFEGYNNYDTVLENGVYYINYYYDDFVKRVTADENGVVKSYNKAYATTEKKGLPEISKNDAKGNATIFVNTAASDIMTEIDLSTAEVTYNTDFRVVFYRKTNGIIFDNNYLSVGVDGDSGEIISYTRVFDKNIKFSDFDTVVSHEDIISVFKSTNGLELRYNKKMVDGVAVAYPVYCVKPTSYYNAVTGRVIEDRTSITYNNYFDVTSMYEKSGTGGYENANMLTVAEIISRVRSISELGITDEYQVERARYLKNANGKYLIVLDFTKNADTLSITVDAQSGIVCELNSVPIISTEKLHDAEIKEIVLNYVQSHMGEYYKNMKLSYTAYGDVSVFLFERVVSGIPFKSNGLCISIDKTGNITNISFMWDDIEFPSTENIISYDEAYDIFEKKCDFKLRYYLQKNEYIPVYALNPLTSGIIDAVTGDILTYDGKIMQPKKYLAYVDLDTHYSKKYVEKMADCDIYVSRGNVALAEPIIQKDYLLLISSYLPSGKPIIENFGDITDGQLEMLYNAFVSEGVIKEEEINYNRYITREKAVEYFIKTLGYGDVANAGNIFLKHFSDSDEIDISLVGYVELARAMGIINGNGTRFMPKAYLSNGDSLIMIYNYLSGR